MVRKKKACNLRQRAPDLRCGTSACGCWSRGPVADLVCGECISPVFFLAVGAARMANREILRPSFRSAPPRGWVPIWAADLDKLLVAGETKHLHVPDGCLFGYARRPASMAHSTHVVGVGMNRQEGDVRPLRI